MDTYDSPAVGFLPSVIEQTFQATQEVFYKVNTKIGAFMSKPINNYLKTEEEIETEFCYANLIYANKDGYSNIHSLDKISISGTMEENY